MARHPRQTCRSWQLFCWLLLAACPGSEQACVENSRPHRGVKLRVLMRNWQSHRMVTHIAAILLRDVLKYDVEIVSAPGSWTTSDDLERLAKGEIDANLELWPKGKEDKFASFVGGSSGAVDVGIHQLPARSGMYVPKYANHVGSFYSYATLKGEDVQTDFSKVSITQGENSSDPNGMCETAAWNCKDLIYTPEYCTDRRCEAQLLKGSLGEDQGLLEQQIRNNGLNFSVAYTSRKTQERLVWEAYATRVPVLFYSWEPRAPIHGIASEEFFHVAFPPKDECTNSKMTGTPLGDVDCDLGSTPLRKVVSPTLNATKDALYFVERFSLTTEDYSWLFAQRTLTDKESNPEEVAACMFVRSNEDRWRSWVVYSDRIEITWDDPCWPTVWWQLGIFAVVLCLMDHRWVLIRRCQCFRSDTSSLLDSMQQNSDAFVAGVVSMEQVSMTLKRRWPLRVNKQQNCDGNRCDKAPQRSMTMTSQWSEKRRETKKMGLGCSLSFLNRFCASDSTRVKTAVLKGEMTFMSWQRTADDFVMLNSDSKSMAPPKCHTPLRGVLATKLDVLHYLVSSSIKDVFCLSCLLGLIGSIWGTISQMIATNYNYNIEVHPMGLEQWLSFGKNLMELSQSFSFLPVFLLGFFVNRECSRWVGLVDLAYGVWGRVEDMALLLAGAVEGVNNTGTAEARRQYLFKAYRWLNAVHYLTYYGVDVRMGSSPGEVLWDLVYAGLLLEEEAEVLLGTPNKMQQVILSWLSCLWHQMQREGVVLASSTHQFTDKLSDLRGSVLHVEQAPNLIKVMLKIVMSLLTLFILIAYPWKLQVADQCFQPWALLSTFLLNFSYIGLLSMMTTLEKSPFVASGDCINADYILCEVELMTFRCIRACFSRDIEGHHLRPSGTLELEEAIMQEAAQVVTASEVLEEDTQEAPEIKVVGEEGSVTLVEI
mmetsp:Transcript_120333/g.312307  ORF Transcript_120333/g.312307 Transcript_120333/m.312307 type:complete len:934 (-) Transcript_120333:477-3278(-)